MLKENYVKQTPNYEILCQPSNGYLSVDSLRNLDFKSASINS